MIRHEPRRSSTAAMETPEESEKEKEEEEGFSLPLPLAFF
jgi:hypothetical protein